MKREDCKCDRCGEPVEAIDVTSYGSASKEYVAGPCGCPIPACPFCWRPIGADGKCGNIGCFFVGNIVPIPEMV